MGRDFSRTTIKALFAEARNCAFPGCDAPLVFRDRGAVTAVADMAHIRSETPGGPRYDAAFRGDINGTENLLLLCGIHHRPVDRHESLYSTEELLVWKAQQVVDAGAGTSISDEDVRAFARLSHEERTALAQVARLAQRLVGLCETAQADVDRIRALNEQARLVAARGFGPVWEVDEDGNRSPEPMSSDSFRLSRVEQDRWDRQVQDIAARHSDPVLAAVAALKEEVAVLRMQSTGLTPWLTSLTTSVDELVRAFGDSAAVKSATNMLDTSVAQLWAAANGDAETPAT